MNNRKKLLQLLGYIVTFSLIFISCNRVATSEPVLFSSSTPSKMQVATLSTTTQVLPQTVIIIIDSVIANGISHSISQFKADLQDDGYNVIQKTWEAGDCQQLREYLAGIHSDTTVDLVGAYLIGNLPVPSFYMYYPATADELERGPETFTTLEYYQDLDGDWDKIHLENLTTANTFDSHTGKIDNEIWIGVLPFVSDVSTTIDKINEYFNKNHKFRIGIDRPEKGYIEPIGGSWGVTSPELYQYQVDQVTNTQWAWQPLTKRGNVGIFPDNTMNDLSKYPDSKYGWHTQMSSNKYDFAVFNFHGDNTNPWNSIKDIRITANFVWDGTCAEANISNPGSSIDIDILYRDNNVVLVAGATGNQGGLGENINGDFRWNIAHDLAKGKSFGQAYLNHTNAKFVGVCEDQREYLGAQFIFLGDPSLKLQEYMPSP